MADHFKVFSYEGFHKKIISPANSDLRYISFSYGWASSLLKFKDNTGKEEWLFVILKGRAEFSVSSKKFGVLERKSVFDDGPSSVYIPPQTDFEFSMDKNSEILAVSAYVSGDFSPYLITQDKIRKKRVGKENYFRTVTDILYEELPAGRLIAGETINDEGNWSSFPPHKHDRDNPPEEVKLEELYFFKINPEKTGFGVLNVYDKNKENLFLLKNNEAVTIPGGYHPVGVIPGHKIYYFWVLAGEIEGKRTMKPNTHSDFKHLL
ncbi:MAG: 5-deoxy-glucuronate isomerase [Candidatus Omnitrophica bacterium]|nr:5-deoxy-glucuronate isomerase [Candidatus Omnitrophota bacterium]